MKKININHIVSLTAYIHRVDHRLEFKPEKKNFLGKTKEGFYYHHDYLGPIYVDAADLINRTIEGHRVYFKPHVEIVTVGGVVHTKYFETAEELTAYIESAEFKDIRWIIA